MYINVNRDGAGMSKQDRVDSDETVNKFTFTSVHCKTTLIPIPSWTHAQAHVNLDQGQPNLWFLWILIHSSEYTANSY